MSTRCQTRVIAGNTENHEQFSEDLTLYHHCDGYPEGMVPLFWQAYLFGITPVIPDWKKDDPTAEPSDFFQYQTFRAGYAASLLCHSDPRGFQPENSHQLHGDIEWYYKLYVRGSKVKGQQYEQWEFEIFAARCRMRSEPVLKRVLKRTPLCDAVNAQGEFKSELVKSLSLQPV